MTTSLSEHSRPLKQADEKRQKKLALIGIGAFLVLTAVFFFVVGRPMIRFVGDPESFRAWAAGHGLWGKFAFVGMMIIQVVVAIIPGEPLEIGAGYAFGIWQGTLLCLIGAIIGSLLVFLFVRRFGMRAVELFFPPEKIAGLKFFHNNKRLNLLVFILFFIPGTPKDIMTYFVGLTPMKLATWLLITATARIPSIITSTVGGDALGLQNYQFAIIVFAITLIISAIGLVVYHKLRQKKTYNV